MQSLKDLADTSVQEKAKAKVLTGNMSVISLETEYMQK